MATAAGDLIVRCGTVVAASDEGCVVAMERERCAACDGRCSVGLSWLGDVQLPVAATSAPAVGERVAVGVPKRGITRAALAVFGLPLAGMLAGAWLGEHGQASAAALAGFGLGAGLAILAVRRGSVAGGLMPRLVSGEAGERTKTGAPAPVGEARNRQAPLR